VKYIPHNSKLKEYNRSEIMRKLEKLSKPVFVKLMMLAVKVTERKILKTWQLLQTTHIYKQYYTKHYSVKWVCVVVKYITDPTEPIQKSRKLHNKYLYSSPAVVMMIN
jgi:hypothetical protein